MATRFDTGTITKVTRTPVGGVRLDARPTKVGVFQYRTDTGEIRREYRPPEEVFHPESLASLKGAPVTIRHPTEEGKRVLVTPENFNTYSKGHVIEEGRTDSDGVHVAAAADINASDAIAFVAAGNVELSMGYTCDEDKTPGVTPEGEPYDLRQIGIRYNHFALLGPGEARGGSTCALRTDSAAGICQDMKITIAGKEYDAGSAEAAAAIKAVEERAQRADAAEKEAAELKKAERLRFRMSLLAQARATKLGPRYLTDEAEAAATDDDTIIKAVIGQLAPNMDLSGLDHAGLMIALKMASSLSTPAEKPKDEPPAGAPPAAPGMALDDALSLRGGVRADAKPKRTMDQVRYDAQRARENAWKGQASK